MHFGSAFQIERLEHQYGQAVSRIEDLYDRDPNTGELDFAATEWSDAKTEQYNAAKQEAERIKADIARYREVEAMRSTALTPRRAPVTP